MPDLSHTLEDYTAEMRQYRLVRSFDTVESLARSRGEGTELVAAECFLLVKGFDR